jgi:hypothetical protein
VLYGSNAGKQYKAWPGAYSCGRAQIELGADEVLVHVHAQMPALRGVGFALIW